MAELSPILDLLVEQAVDFSAEIAANPVRSTEILARVGSKTFAFSHNWVTDILLLPQAQILALPFYPATILGVIHHQGMALPVVLGQKLLNPEDSRATALPETLTILRLNATVLSAQTGSGIGLVVDQIMGQQTTNAAASTNFIAPTEAIKFQPEMLPAHLWQPLRYSA
jgi:chemotaxis signal transduction protein